MFAGPNANPSKYRRSDEVPRRLETSLNVIGVDTSTPMIMDCMMRKSVKQTHRFLRDQRVPNDGCVRTWRDDDRWYPAREPTDLRKQLHWQRAQGEVLDV